ncbi:hypothetical protein ScPMuIL_001492 [Solemya velum]
MSVDWVSAAYAVTVAAGGIIGYVKAGSIISMAMGLASGALMGFGVYQMSHDPKNITLSLAVSGILLALMGYRYMNSGKIMPAGLVASLSLMMVIRLVYRMT